MTRLVNLIISNGVLMLAVAPSSFARGTQSTTTNSNPTPATQVAPAQAPDEMTKKISDLVHAGKYAEAQKLCDGLLIAYPNDQRLIQAKALIEKLLASSAAPATVDASAPPAVAGPEAVPLTGMDKVDYNALIVLMRQAQQTTDLAEQLKLLSRFMEQRQLFLKKYADYNSLRESAVQADRTTDPDGQNKLKQQILDAKTLICKRHPEQMLLWQLSASAALSLNWPLEGYRAGNWLLAFGGADSNDPALQELLGQLKNKGWLDRQSAINAQNEVLRQRVGQMYSGTWYGRVAAPDNHSFMKGCLDTELNHKCLFYTFIEPDGGGKIHPFQLNIQSDGTIVVSDHTSFAGCRGNVYGVPVGPAFKDVRWEIRPAGEPARQIFSVNLEDGSQFGFSCNRPQSGEYKARWNYVIWLRTLDVAPSAPRRH